MRRYFAPLSVCIVLIVLAVALRAGPLDPPAGPIAPTYKTLSEVEPRVAINSTNTPGDADSLYKITLPGSYYLTGNVNGGAGRHGIEIAASGVTVDLGGFELLGVPGSLDGVSATAAGLSNIAVTNGSIRAWGGSAVNFVTQSVSGCRIEGVLAGGNGLGIRGGLSTTMTRCSASGNTGLGLQVGTGSTIAGCTCQSNGFGVSVGNNCAVLNSISSTNSSHGFTLGNGTTITGCSSNFNSLDGISASFGDTITACTLLGNTGAGVSASGGCSILDCVVRGNALDGIECGHNCLVRGNTCDTDGNGAGDGAGIHATGADNRIENNNCTLSDRGIDVDVAGNLIVRNTCAGNTTNWTIAANNVFGPILDRTAPASGAVNGNAAASSLGSTDANANYTY